MLLLHEVVLKNYLLGKSNAQLLKKLTEDLVKGVELGFLLSDSFIIVFVAAMDG